jgi:hypothetical protein
MRIGTSIQPLAPKPHYSNLSETVLVTKDVVGFVFGDLPTLAEIGANVLPVPANVKHLFDGPSTANTLFLGASLVGTGVDLHRLVKVYKDPDSTSFERKVELGHLILADIIPTATSLIPILGMHGPLAHGIFVGTQLAGVASDGAKTVYDIKKAKQHRAA